MNQKYAKIEIRKRDLHRVWMKYEIEIEMGKQKEKKVIIQIWRWEVILPEVERDGDAEKVDEEDKWRSWLGFEIRWDWERSRWINFVTSLLFNMNNEDEFDVMDWWSHGCD
jgi:hypothetical protein